MEAIDHGSSLTGKSALFSFDNLFDEFLHTLAT